MRKAIREVKNVMYQFSPIELKVRAATNNDRFLVSTAQLAEIARATNDYQEYPQLFAMLWKRLCDLEHVMHVQKALHVTEYLLRHGAERFINDAKRRARDIAALQKYKHYDENNQDDAKEARARAKAVYALLMDDQLLAQERGKSARLASEGRLAGMGTIENGELDDYYGAAPNRGGAGASRGGSYDDGYGDDQPARAPVRRAAASAAAPASSAPRASSAVPKSGAVRRRSLDEDPFEEAVIPTAVTGPPVKPRERPSAAAQQGQPTPRKSAAAAAAAPKKAAAPAPEEEEEAEEEDEAARKAAKKAKKKAKKEAEARAAAEAEAAAAAQQQQAKPRANGHHQQQQAAPANSLASFDLSSFAVEEPKRGGGEIDLLSAGSLAAMSSGAGGDVNGEQALEDLFASSSLTDEQVSSPMNYHSSGNPFRSPEPPGGGGFEGQSGAPSASAASSVGAGAGPLSPTGALVNLNDLNAPRQNPQHSSVDSGVSMSMMRSIQPLGAPVSNTPTTNNAHRRSNIPSSVPLAQQHPHAYTQQGAFLYGGAAIGGPPQGGYPMGGGYPVGMYPQQQGAAHPGMQLFGGGMGGMGGPQPLAIMPPGMGSQGANMNMGGMMGAAPPAGPMMHYGAQQQAPHHAAYGGIPAASPSHLTFTQMRQSKPTPAQGPIIFDVPSAQPRQPNGQQSLF